MCSLALRQCARRKRRCWPLHLVPGWRTIPHRAMGSLLPRPCLLPPDAWHGPQSPYHTHAHNHTCLRRSSWPLHFPLLPPPPWPSGRCEVSAPGCRLRLPGTAPIPLCPCPLTAWPPASSSREGRCAPACVQCARFLTWAATGTVCATLPSASVHSGQELLGSGPCPTLAHPTGRSVAHVRALPFTPVASLSPHRLAASFLFSRSSAFSSAPVSVGA